MIDRIDLLIAVIGIVVTAAGASFAFAIGASRKADQDHIVWLEARIDRRLGSLERRCNRIEEKVDNVVKRSGRDGDSRVA